MINILLEKLNKMEEEKFNIIKKNKHAKKIIEEILSHEKVKKEDLLKALQKINALLTCEESPRQFDGRFLTFDAFLDVIKNEKDFYLMLIDADMEEKKQKFILGYMTNKISPIFTIKDGVIYGLIKSDQINMIKKLNKLPFYDPETSEFEEIELYKVLFFIDELRITTLKEIEQKFKEFRTRPSYKKKHFIVYSIPQRKILDFEAEELKKEKEKYNFVDEESYPVLESKLKKDLKNIPFIIRILERIDRELDSIKQSRGVINVVNRILNNIEMAVGDEEIQRMVKTLRNNLKDY